VRVRIIVVALGCVTSGVYGKFFVQSYFEFSSFPCVLWLLLNRLQNRARSALGGRVAVRLGRLKKMVSHLRDGTCLSRTARQHGKLKVSTYR
jgi:hypothetical protein